MTEPDPAFYAAIGGTWSWTDADRGQWWQPTSELAKFLICNRLFPLRPTRPFRWSGRVGGMQFWRRMFGKSSDADHIDWKAAAAALLDHLDHPDAPTPYHARNVIAHSHGGQVAFYAAAQGLKMRTLITVGTPVREDMAPIIQTARQHIGCWVHIYDRGDDDWARRGTFGDGDLDMPWNCQQTFALADRCDNVDGIHHSDVLNDPKHFHLFEDQGWLQILRTGATPTA